jgi:hypothetical protein
MSSIKTLLKNVVNSLDKSAQESNAKLLEMVKNKNLVGTFSQITFSEAAAAEHALSAISHSADFVNGEIVGNTLDNFTDKEITDSCEEILNGINSQLETVIGVKMSSTDCHILNGLNRASIALKKVLKL